MQRLLSHPLKHIPENTSQFYLKNISLGKDFLRSFNVLFQRGF